ncbi:MAG TPA: exonuclease SbcCD subunit D [Candidatus Thermoplasmatota archaeon]|nr:exonuclease SbcCD subunit D [Candidatus Thermoplasmatota archaeon]
MAAADHGTHRDSGGAVRIVHFSDTHLGHQQYPRVDENGLNQRERDLYDAFDAVIAHAIDTKADLVVHAGDLFDGVRPSNRALAHALEGFLRLSKAGIPAVVIAGNHEHPKLRETGSSFRLFAHLDGIHPVYQGKRQTVEFTVKGRKVRVHAVPQCPDQASIAREIAEAPVAADGGIDLLVVHGAVTTLADIPQAEFNELSLEPSWFAPFHHVALGHFHGVKQAAANAWYCGAPDRVSMAESGQDKGFLELTFPASSTTPDVRFKALAVRPYADLPVLHADGMDGGQIVAASGEALARAPAGAVTRLRIEGIAPELRGSLDRRSIQDAAKHLLHLDLRPEFAGHAATAAGPTGFRGLVAEFDSFAAVTPMPGLDRGAVVALAKSMLVGGPP